MQETTLLDPKPVKITQRSETEISRAEVPQLVEQPPLSPQKVHHAFYRPFVADHIDEKDIAAPMRPSVSYHSVDELSQSQFGVVKTVVRAEDKSSAQMYKRLGFDNVPSY